MRIDKAKIKYPNKKTKQSSEFQRVSAYSESYKGEYYNIDTVKLIPYKKQTRKIFDNKSLQNLAKTIKLHGIRQPLTILPSLDSSGKYEIISGERRWRAAQIVGLKKVPCIILQDRKAAEEIALIENVQRKNLHPLELMDGFQSLLDQGVCRNHQELADKIGVGRTLVVETLSLKKLPEKTKKLILENNIKAREALRVILKLPQSSHKKYIDGIIANPKVITSEREKRKPKKLNFLSLYLQSEKVLYSRDSDIKLNQEQKEEIKKYLNNVISSIN